MKQSPASTVSPATAEFTAIIERHMLRRHGGVDDIPMILIRAKGTRVWDVDGKEYLDFFSGRNCATVGHNHPRLVEAIQGACASMLHNNGWAYNDVSIRLAEALGRLLPDSLAKMLFKSNASDANETALHLAKAYAGKWEVVTTDRSHFGSTAGARSLTHAFGRKGHGPGVYGSFSIPAPDSYRCPIRHCENVCDMTCVDVGFEQFDSHSEGSPAAVIVESVISGGGVLIPPDGYFARLRDKAHERGMLLILDEAATAPARSGTMFAFEQFGMVPDILTLSKTLGGGVPLSCTATSVEIDEASWRKGFTSGSEDANNPLSARVGLAVLEVIQEEGLVAAAKWKGDYMRDQLNNLTSRHEAIGVVRGRGLLIGIEFVTDRAKKTPALDVGRNFERECRARGLLINTVLHKGRSSVSRIAPPLTVTQAEMDQALHIMDEALAAAVASTSGPR